MGMDAEQRPHAGHLGRDAGAADGCRHPGPQPVAQAIEAGIGRGVELSQAGEPGRHGHRVGGEGAAMGDGGLARSHVEHVHDRAPAGDRADRQAAADDLAQGDEVGLQPPQRVGAAMGQAEADDLVQDEHDAEPPRRLAQRLHIALAGADHADPRRQRVEQQPGDAVAVGLEDADGGLGVVEGDHHGVADHGIGGAAGIFHPGRRALAPVRRLRVEADLHMVVAAVVGALDLGDRRPAGIGARRLDRAQHRLAAAVGEADGLEGGRAGADMLRQLHLDPGRQAEADPAHGTFRDRGHHLRVGVPVDRGKEVVGEIDDYVAVHVDDARSFPMRGIGGMRIIEDRRAGAAARHHPQRALEQRLRAGGGVARRRHGIELAVSIGLAVHRRLRRESDQAGRVIADFRSGDRCRHMDSGGRVGCD